MQLFVTTRGFRRTDDQTCKKRPVETGTLPSSITRLTNVIFDNAAKADRLASLACLILLAVPIVMFAITLVGIAASPSFRDAGFDIVWLPVVQTLPLMFVGSGLFLLNRRFSRKREQDLHKLEEALIEDGFLSHR